MALSKWQHEWFWFLAAPFHCQAWEGLCLTCLTILVQLVHYAFAWVSTRRPILNTLPSVTVFALGQSIEPVHCLRSKESKLRQCVAS